MCPTVGSPGAFLIWKIDNMVDFACGSLRDSTGEVPKLRPLDLAHLPELEPLPEVRNALLPWRNNKIACSPLTPTEIPLQAHSSSLTNSITGHNASRPSLDAFSRRDSGDYLYSSLCFLFWGNPNDLSDSSPMHFHFSWIPLACMYFYYRALYRPFHHWGLT